tara:strand:- start:569 stop:1087 length:519 start_codon:yes stop_codon:yes gene_type:complete
MKQEINKKEKQDMKKTTFTTLKAKARRGELFHRVRAEHSVYGMEWYTNDRELPIVQTTLEDLDKFKVTKNFIQTENLTDSDADAQLSNCVYVVMFYFGNGNRGNLEICETCGATKGYHCKTTCEPIEELGKSIKAEIKIADQNGNKAKAISLMSKYKNQVIEKKLELITNLK